MDALGKEIERDTVDGAQNGEDLRLTIDAGIQAHTEEVLSQPGADLPPKGATAIVMDPRDAQVLAMANWPPRRPKRSGLGRRRATLRNMATGFTYEPGSTFKAFTVAGALEENLVTPSTVFDLAGRDPGRRPDDLGRRGARPGNA